MTLDMHAWLTPTYPALISMSTPNMGESGDTTHNHHVDGFDMNNDDLLNNDQLNAAWRRAGALIMHYWTTMSTQTKGKVLLHLPHLPHLPQILLLHLPQIPLLYNQQAAGHHRHWRMV